MNYFLERSEQEISAACSQIIGVETSEIDIEEPNAKFDADLAVPCFKFAAQKSKSPQELASQLAAELRLEMIESVEAVGGFVNIWLKPTSLAEGIHQDLVEEQSFGERSEGQGKKVIVDFIGLNLSKPFSVGHLRPTLQGQALINLYRALGYEVVGDSHIGDWGTPFGMWVVGFKKWGSDEALQKEGAYELGRLYVKFREEAEANPELIDKAKNWLKKLETGDDEAVGYRERFSKISLDHMNAVLARLGVIADENLGESFYVPGAKALVGKLIKEGAATKQDDNSVIIPLADLGIETPALLQKSDGSLLYAMTDIETIRYRLERWQPEKIIYSVGGEQQFHFQQVFAVAGKLGYETELVHPWFGTIDEKDETGKRAKMSSRKNTALLESLLDKAHEVARSNVNQENNLTDDDINKIAIGAIKFTEFAQARRTNILFDWDRMFSLLGFSGPYVQYAAVRVRSILQKLDEQSDEQLELSSVYDWKTEKSLLAQLAKYPGVVREAATEYEPHRVAQYTYDLARAWNKYYEEVSIVDSEGEERKARIQMLRVLSHNFEHSLGLLGIEIPKRM